MKPSAVVVPDSMRSMYDNFHFAAAARSRDLLICSGQLGTGADGRVVDGPEAQFTAAFENVRTVLAEAGLDMNDVVEITTFHVGLRDHIATFMKVKDAFMPPPYTAWTAIGVSELAFPGALVEIRATAELRTPAVSAAPSAKKSGAKKRGGAGKAGSKVGSKAKKKKKGARKKTAPKKKSKGKKKRAAGKK